MITADKLKQNLRGFASEEVIRDIQNGKYNQRVGGSDSLAAGLIFTPSSIDPRVTYVKDGELINETDFNKLSDTEKAEVRQYHRLVFNCDNCEVSFKYFLQNNSRVPNDAWEGSVELPQGATIWVPKTKNVATFAGEYAKDFKGKQVLITKTATITENNIERKYIEFAIL